MYRVVLYMEFISLAGSYTAAVMAAGERQITEQHLSDDFLEDVRPGPSPGPASVAVPQALEIPAQRACDDAAGRIGERIAERDSERDSERDTDCSPGRTLGEAEIDMIRAALAAVNGNISEASKRLGISRNTIYRKLRWGKPA